MFLTYGAAPEISLYITISGDGENPSKNAQVYSKMAMGYQSYHQLMNLMFPEPHL